MKKRNLSLTLLHSRRKVGCREKNGINLEIMQRNWEETVIPVQVRTCLIALYKNNFSLNQHTNTGRGPINTSSVQRLMLQGVFLYFSPHRRRQYNIT